MWVCVLRLARRYAGEEEGSSSPSVHAGTFQLRKLNHPSVNDRLLT